MAPLLEVNNLATHFHTRDGVVHAVNGVSFRLGEGEMLALVGESGSGKSVTMLSVMRLIPEPPGEIVSGEVRFGGRDLLRLPQREMRRIRGKDIAMIFQDPMSSLNPVHRVGRQIEESIRLHTDLSPAATRARTLELLELVGIPDAAARAADYPHQFSGGMRQRVMIAMALACNPRILIADEPTTALDVTIQAQIVALVRDIQQKLGMAVVWITHDLGLVAGLADRVMVMYGGRVVEEGPVEAIYPHSRHPYTLGLLESVPRLRDAVPERLREIAGAPPDMLTPPSGCTFAPRCSLARAECTTTVPPLVPTDVPGVRSACLFWEALAESGAAPHAAGVPTHPAAGANGRDDGALVRIEGLKTHFAIRRGLLGRRASTVRAVDGVSLSIAPGETVGLVGESGCGKTTLGRTILRLYEPVEGSIRFDGQELAGLPRHEMQPIRRRMQMIFQDPYASMNPRMPVWKIIGEPLEVHGERRPDAIRARAAELLEHVGLNPDHLERYPHEFSGGQRQRIVIARALALNPDFIICDEPVSSLDVSVQAQIINLLKTLQRSFGLTYLFIAHDLAVVRHISDRVAVMYLGKIVELADRDRLYAGPLHPYTQALLSAVPVPDPALEAAREQIVLEGDLPSPASPPAGCRFHTRCPIAEVGLCDVEEPPLREVEPGHWAACHLV